MSELVELIHHDNEIREFIFHDNSRKVAEAYFEKIRDLLDNLPDDVQEIKVIVNLTESGMPPFAQMTRHARTMMHDQRKRLSNIHMKSAFLTGGESQIMLSLVNTFTQLMPIDMELRSFGQSERDKAIEWLLT